MKKLILTSAMSVFLLTGCGGSDDNKESKINLEGKWTEFNEWASDHGDYLQVTNNQLNIFDWQDDSFNIMTAFNAYLEHFENVGIVPAGMISPKGLFDLDFNNDTDTYNLGKITQSSNSSWIITPNKEEGTADLKFNFAVKKIDLTGKNLLAAFPSLKVDIDLSPDYWDEELIAQLKDSKFPKGSYCLAPTSLKSTTDFLLGVVSSGDDDETYYDDALLFDNLETFYQNFTDATLTNKKFIYEADFKGKLSNEFTDYYYGYFTGNYDGLFYGASIYVSPSINLISTSYDFDENSEDLTNSQKALFKDRCVYFNANASEYIKETYSYN